MLTDFLGQEKHQDGVFIEDDGDSALVNLKSASTAAAKLAAKSHTTPQILKCERIWNHTVFILRAGKVDKGEPRYDHLVCQRLNEAAGVLTETAYMHKNPTLFRNT